MNYEEEISSRTITMTVVNTAITARQKIESMETEDSLIIVHQFLETLSEAGICIVDGAMTDLEKIQAGMYAANLYLAACANIGKLASLRKEQVEGLEQILRKS